MIWNLIGTIGGEVLDIVDDVVEEFFVTGLDAQRDGRQAAGARLDAEALRRACQLHGGEGARRAQHLQA